MVQINAKLAFKGNCEEAFRLYAEVLDGQITYLLHYRDSAALAANPELADQVVHATLVIGNSKLTGADIPAESFKAPVGTSLQINIDDAEKTRRIYDVLSAGASIDFPLQKTFWSELYATLTDRFGTIWEINCVAPNSTPSTKQD